MLLLFNHKQIITHTIGLLSYPFPKNIVANNQPLIGWCFTMPHVPILYDINTSILQNSTSSRHHTNTSMTVNILQHRIHSTHIISTLYRYNVHATEATKQKQQTDILGNRNLQNIIQISYERAIGGVKSEGGYKI